MNTKAMIWAMRSFIACVFVASLFGPYVISILIGSLGLSCYFFRDEAGSHL